MASQNDHRKRAAGRRIKARMPRKEEINTGTRIHEQSRYEEEIPDVEQCPQCFKFVELDELYDNQGVCLDCSNHNPEEQ